MSVVSGQKTEHCCGRLPLAVIELAVDEFGEHLDLIVLHQGVDEHGLHLGVVVRAGHASGQPTVS